MNPHSGLVYLLHFERPLGSDLHQAQHYIGWALDLAARMADHRAGRGAAITRAALDRGIAFEVVRTWPDRDRLFERALKAQKRGPRLCPVCGGAHALRRACGSSCGVQLALELDPAPWESPEYQPPWVPMDWYELSTLRRWSVARAALIPPVNDYSDI